MYYMQCYRVYNFYLYGCDIHIFPLYEQPLTVLEVLWVCGMRDFILKLITIIFKVFLTCLPSEFLTITKRRQYFLLVEATSELCQCIAPIPLWLYYYLGVYEGLERIFEIILSLLYVVNKGIDLLPMIKACLTSIQKLL